jgi:hypothetical protein
MNEIDKAIATLTQIGESYENIGRGEEVDIIATDAALELAALRADKLFIAGELAKYIAKCAALRNIAELAAITDGLMPSDIAAREAAQAYLYLKKEAKP